MKSDTHTNHNHSLSEQKHLINRELEDCLQTANCASATDGTGIVTHGPQSGDATKAYGEVYHYKPQPAKTDRNT